MKETIVEIAAVLSGSWPALVLQFIMIARGNHSNGVTFVISFKKLQVTHFIYGFDELKNLNFVECEVFNL